MAELRAVEAGLKTMSVEDRGRQAQQQQPPAKVAEDLDEKEKKSAKNSMSCQGEQEEDEGAEKVVADYVDQITVVRPENAYMSTWSMVLFRGDHSMLLHMLGRDKVKG